MFRMIPLAVALAACRPPVAPRPHLALQTTAEQSHWVRTGHFDEAVLLCEQFALAYEHVTCDHLGTTSEDRPIVAIRIERKPGAPYLYVQGGIHAGEIEGKDAGLWFFRDLLDGKVAPGALDAVNVVFVPVINPDGHERFGPNNRPNQRGPEEMGFRVNGQRFNLNRDFMKADTLEIGAVLRVFREREPVVIVDLHTTDGAKFEHDIAIDLAPVAPRGDHFEATVHTLSEALIARMTALGHLPIGEFYPSFVKDEDPMSGFAIGEAPPRFSQTYAGQRNAIGMLVETHSWKPYAARVLSTYHTLQALFEQAVTQAPAWVAATTAARTASRRLGGTELPVVFENGKHSRPLAFRGYHYERRISDLTGGVWNVYDETKPEIWNIPLYDEIIPKITVHVPKAGYVIEGGFAGIAAGVFDRHGIAYQKIGNKRLAVDAFRATKATFAAAPYEGHTRATFEGAWAPETRTFDAGAIFVSIDQPLARVVVNLLDPAAPDSLAQWGFWNQAFEPKEYQEAYVTEDLARALIAKDPALRTAFDAAVAADPALAASPDKKLEWFYRHTPAWDERLNLLPIFRADTPPL